MTQIQFHEGQEVEVYDGHQGHGTFWRKANIVENQGKPDVNLDVWDERLDYYRVQFPNGISAVFDAEHIREVADLNKTNEKWERDFRKAKNFYGKLK